MNVKIFHKPLKQKLVFLPFNTIEEAVMPLYTIQRREIGHECFLLNGMDLAAILAADGADIAALAQKLPNFSIVLNLWGGQFFPDDRIAYEEKAVNDICDQYHCSVTEALSAVRDANVQLQGMLNGPWQGDVYWKDRAKGACLEIVFQNGLDKVPALWNSFTRLAGEYGIDTRELGMYIQPRQRCRVCHVEFHIPCDPQGADLANVKAFQRRAAETLINEGAFFYRPYYDWASMIYARCGYTYETIKKLKNILDPNRTLNPGKILL